MAEHSEIVLSSKQIISGEFIPEKGVIVESAVIMFLGTEFKKLELTDNKFEFEITEQFENGSYDVVFRITGDSENSAIKHSFIVSNDKIDPSLPLDMQQLI